MVDEVIDDGADLGDTKQLAVHEAVDSNSVTKEWGNSMQKVVNAMQF